jgi:hypothetical protein
MTCEIPEARQALVYERKCRRHEAREEAFLKWLSSTKFQIFAIVFIFTALLIIDRLVPPIEALKEIVKLGIAYMAADVVSPIAKVIGDKIKDRLAPCPPEAK